MELIPLVAGPLRMVFDPQLAFLRYVCCDGIEVIRGIYVAVRDQAWNTIPFEVSDLRVEDQHGSFSLGWTARCTSDEVAFEWRNVVAGSNQGTLGYRFDGEAKSSFLRNRIGICLLHPAHECAGQPCRVEHADGTETDGTFPLWIAPHQPFKNIRSIKHAVRQGRDLRVEFEGDAFEMEDQRNWTDTSFKTYSTPLERPYPVRLHEGDRVRQTVTVEVLDGESVVDGNADAIRLRSTHRELADEDVRIRVDWDVFRTLPQVGLSTAHSAVGEPCAAVTSLLKEARPDHLRVDLHLASDIWRDHLRNASRLAEQIDAQLELVIFCDSIEAAAWPDCLAALAAQRRRTARWLVLPESAKATPGELAFDASKELRAIDSQIPIVFGTDRNFAELNRNRPAMPTSALVCYSIHPQMHASDNASLCETIEGQAATVQSAHEYFRTEVVISPITLRPRYKSAATVGMDHFNDRELPADDRQSTGFLAAWTVGTLSRLAVQPKLASITLYETHGPRGIVDLLGVPYPTHSVFRAMREYQSACATTSSEPLAVVGLGMTGANGRRGILVGNMSSQRRRVVTQTASGTALLGVIEPEAVKHITDC